MVKDRLSLHEELKDLLGSSNVYFQPPSSHKMNYPCIRYELGDIKTFYANGSPYSTHKSYRLTIIDKDPDSIIPDKVLKLPMCKFDRHYTADNLNHFVYNIFY